MKRVIACFGRLTVLLSLVAAGGGLVVGIRLGRGDLLAGWLLLVALLATCFFIVSRGPRLGLQLAENGTHE